LVHSALAPLPRHDHEPHREMTGEADRHRAGDASRPERNSRVGVGCRSWRFSFWVLRRPIRYQVAGRPGELASRNGGDSGLRAGQAANTVMDGRLSQQLSHCDEAEQPKARPADDGRQASPVGPANPSPSTGPSSSKHARQPEPRMPRRRLSGSERKHRRGTRVERPGRDGGDASDAACQHSRPSLLFIGLRTPRRKAHEGADCQPLPKPLT
jgi:hypothetical protein